MHTRWMPMQCAASGLLSQAGVEHVDACSASAQASTYRHIRLEHLNNSLLHVIQLRAL